MLGNASSIDGNIFEQNVNNHIDLSKINFPLLESENVNGSLSFRYTPNSVWDCKNYCIPTEEKFKELKIQDPDLFNRLSSLYYEIENNFLYEEGITPKTMNVIRSITKLLYKMS